MNYYLQQRNRFLYFLARKTIEKYKPGIIAVAGNIGKTSTVEAIYTVLRELRDVRKTNSQFSPELAVPLAIIGEWQQNAGGIFWIHVFSKSIINLLKKEKYPELLILEYDVRTSRAMERLLKVARPQISVITALKNLPPHELVKIISSLPSNGYAILNYDDPGSYGMKERTRAHIMPFGMQEGAALRIMHLEYRTEALPDEGNKPLGISFKLACGEALVPVRLDANFGAGAAYAAAAAASVGTVFGLNLVRIAEALHYHASPPHRLQLIPGKKGIYLFDDTNDASHAATEEALAMLEALPAKRIIGILGALKTEGEDSTETSEMLFTRAAKICDILFLVGSMPTTIDKKKIVRFDTPEAAVHEAHAIIERGDIILIKGMGTELIARELCSHRLVA